MRSDPLLVVSRGIDHLLAVCSTTAPGLRYTGFLRAREELELVERSLLQRQTEL